MASCPAEVGPLGERCFGGEMKSRVPRCGAELVRAIQAQLGRNVEASSSWEGKMASKSKMLSSLISDEVRGDQGGKPVSSTALVTIEHSPDTLFRVFQCGSLDVPKGPLSELRTTAASVREVSQLARNSRFRWPRHSPGLVHDPSPCKATQVTAGML